MLALCLGQLPFTGHLRRVATDGVLPIGDWLQVIWINTGRITAKVVELQTVGDWTPEQFVDNPMRNPRAAVRIDLAVTVWVA